ncbi:VOC family protein [Nocardioides sp.]|uniref:VOC family protein n=1 Tax=Nocardioides sp. TaxID=35761 RepID=UPI00273647D3|nr:VOC family protein [Nocardioides sp.]MDP3890225.1 VOC family protein [Nocardioides sp.]
MNDFPGIGHVALTVTSLAVSRPWYQLVIGADPVLDEPTDGGFHHTVFSIGGTLLGLHEHPATTTDPPFSELRPGLDHVAFACSDRQDLLQWQQRLDDLGIPHGGIVDASYGSGLAFRDPDGIALELFAPPA